jgi:acyl-homoserine lactone acylase PvdQ
MKLRCVLLGLVAAGITAAGPASPAAQAQVPPYGTNNYGTFWYVLPPGNSGNDTLTQLGAFETLGTYPPHTADQTALYNNLQWGYPTLTDQTIGRYFIDGTFGVPPGDAGTVVHPEPGATIIWDARYGVPHIYGDTRPELEFAAGWAAAEDRLFEMDALRHVGRADVAAFAGGANANQDAFQWAVAPYTESELNAQITTALARYGAEGQQLYADATAYVNGINAYIAQLTPLSTPAEYTALGTTPQPFKLADLVAIASAIAGVEGDGGGTELAWTQLMQDIQRRLGSRAGYRAMLDFHAIDDPRAPTTVWRTRFPYDEIPSRVLPGSEAIPDPGSVLSSPEQVLTSASGAQRRTSALTVMNERERFAGFLPTGDSNALLISARESASGHPLAVMGPQLGYYSPSIIYEEDLHGPGIDADGAAVPGVSLYVELGHGPDYAWSATSGYEGVTSTFAVPLCNPSGGPVSIDSNDYEFEGACRPMDILTRTESWKPNLADPTPAGSQTLTAYRTAIGLVEARATIHGRPVAYVLDRSTYDHEIDSAIGFMLFNEPAAMRGPLDFEHAASQIGYTFNWFYADNRHIAYFNSGLLPVRGRGINPLFPVWASHPWVGFDPANNTSADEPAYAHPQVIDQPFLDSWNNLEAQGYSTADSATEFSSVWRVQLLTDGIRAALAHGHKLTLAGLIAIMERAGTQDLRGVADLPYLLRVIGRPSDPTLAGAVAQLRAWLAAGAHRYAPSNLAPYLDGPAIQIMDAWWPLLTRAMFEPAIGAAAWTQLQQVSPFDQPPASQADSPGASGQVHQGSAWDVGFYGTVQTDLEDILGLHPADALSRRYCGGGTLAGCRAVLESTLREALAEPATQVYPGFPGCAAGDQACADAISFQALGALKQPLMQWVNRPTFQQALEVTAHAPGAQPAPACALRSYPTLRIGRVRRRADRVTVTGTALPRDCGVPSARLKRVRVTLGRRHAYARVGRGGRFAVTFRHARGGRVRAQVTDASGNIATAAR